MNRRDLQDEQKGATDKSKAGVDSFSAQINKPMVFCECGELMDPFNKLIFTECDKCLTKKLKQSENR